MKLTPAAIKQAYNRNPDAGHFFDRRTMQFFGDRMASYSTIEHGGQTYMFRKPSASVNVFGRWHTAGRAYFNCWRVVETGGRMDLQTCDTETTGTIYALIASRY